MKKNLTDFGDRIMEKQSKKSPTICIIGAGPCGLTAAKNLLQEGLTNFDVFESFSRVGGNWVYEEHPHSSIYETTHIISSKRLSEFEDFPMPDEYPDYPSHQQILTYFENYAHSFGVIPYIQFNTTVLSVSPSDNKKWKVVFNRASVTQEKFYDYVLVANGHHWDPYQPVVNGHFSGDILHAHAYKKASAFKDRRVLVVGGGNSACDIAVEISRVASKTCISMRRGQHIFPKFILGKPTDIAFAKVKWMPLWSRQWLARGMIRLLQGRYAKYHLKKPTCKPLEIHPTINSELLYFIRHGKIKTHSGIQYFDDQTIYFDNGNHDVFDTVIFATGYQISFPFFDKHLIDFSEVTRIPLYRKMVHLDYDNLFFIGLFQPQGCIWPLADYQAKIAAKFISGNLTPPSNLLNKIQKEMRESQSTFKNNRRHALEVDYQTFRRQLRKELKIK